MNRIPEHVIDALRTITQFVSDSPLANVIQDVDNEKVIMQIDGETYLSARCNMDSAPAAVKDYCKQVIPNIHM